MREAHDHRAQCALSNHERRGAFALASVFVYYCSTYYKAVDVDVFLFLRTPSRAPQLRYGTPSACANRAAYPDPTPVVPDPESIDAQAAYRGRHNT